jgi:hypothetical protein
MDKLIQQLEKLTKSGLAQLPEMTEEKLTTFMEQRTPIIEALLQRIPSSNEKQLYGNRIQAILSHDDAFIEKMEHFKEEARDQLNRLDAGRTQRNSYDSAYNQESFFFDKKK